MNSELLANIVQMGIMLINVLTLIRFANTIPRLLIVVLFSILELLVTTYIIYAYALDDAYIMILLYIYFGFKYMDFLIAMVLFKRKRSR